MQVENVTEKKIDARITEKKLMQEYCMKVVRYVDLKILLNQS